ncbi:THO complex subunit 7-like [Stylophora pistillata]|uniref:THO complex subunit 7-like n=1 Tax=Stylophora pistillata TaxID=50429 RepID=A0A2B4RJE4_STYPI|nr:THO complex subunit 7-like [Stylophora pistillata]
MATDDEIIRKRLLIDGEGAGDDRRITALLKTFLKWCNSTGEEEDNDATYQKMLIQLAQCEFAIGKTQTVFEMNELETENYEKIYSEIEYDALAKVISQHPERQETLQQIEELDKELSSLTTTKESLFSKLELRQKQFHLLINTIHELQQMLEEDKTDTDEPSSTTEPSAMDTS